MVLLPFWRARSRMPRIKNPAQARGENPTRACKSTPMPGNRNYFFGRALQNAFERKARADSRAHCLVIECRDSGRQDHLGPKTCLNSSLMCSRKVAYNCLSPFGPPFNINERMIPEFFGKVKRGMREFQKLCASPDLQEPSARMGMAPGLNTRADATQNGTYQPCLMVPAGGGLPLSGGGNLPKAERIFVGIFA